MISHPCQIDVGREWLGYLFQAAQDGQSVAVTSIGKFYLGQPENAALAFDNLMTGLKLGDTDAGVLLADHYIAKNEFGQAFDYSLLAATSGTSRGSSEAEMNRPCGIRPAYRRPARVRTADRRRVNRCVAALRRWGR
ncbi:hypothetical protein [Devosia sp.]|uniref:hypothetical protein n=1 Tax=Devosia sp. TaxID=1871048 RepID=UPI001AC06414|nr:hypothetical protein [Devosia sp.]MBN9334234.1 hypothetical protein [Devosia sp.]